jgi:hypothetical protein
VWDKNHAYRILVGKPDGKRPLERSPLKWGTLNWMLNKLDKIQLAEDGDQWQAIVNRVMNFGFCIVRRIP